MHLNLIVLYETELHSYSILRHTTLQKNTKIACYIWHGHCDTKSLIEGSFTHIADSWSWTADKKF